MYYYRDELDFIDEDVERMRLIELGLYESEQEIRDDKEQEIFMIEQGIM